MALGTWLAVTEKNPSGSWIVNLQDFVRLLSTSEYLKKYFENDYKSQIEGKKWQIFEIRYFISSIYFDSFIILCLVVLKVCVIYWKSDT